MTERISQNAGCLYALSECRAVAELACAWANADDTNQEASYYFSKYAADSKQKKRQSHVDGAISYAALRVVLESKSDSERQERLGIFEATATADSLVYYAGSMADAPVMLLASEKYNVRREILQVVARKTAGLKESQLVCFPLISYMLAAQYVKSGDTANYKAFKFWIKHRPAATLTADLLVKLVAALHTKTMCSPLLEKTILLSIEDVGMPEHRLRSILSKLFLLASKEVLDKTLTVCLYKDLVLSLVAEAKRTTDKPNSHSSHDMLVIDMRVSNEPLPKH